MPGEGRGDVQCVLRRSAAVGDQGNDRRLTTTDVDPQQQGPMAFDGFTFDGLQPIAVLAVTPPRPGRAGTTNTLVVTGALRAPFPGASSKSMTVWAGAGATRTTSAASLASRMEDLPFEL